MVKSWGGQGGERRREGGRAVWSDRPATELRRNENKA